MYRSSSKYSLHARHMCLGLCLLVGKAIANANPSTFTVIPPLPGTPGTVAQTREADAYCAIDFSSGNTAVCPKSWSTSAAALVYDLTGTSWDSRRVEFESQAR